MEIGDVVKIDRFSTPGVKIEHPLHALVISKAGGSDNKLVVISGGYKAGGGWCRNGFKFHLPDRIPYSSNWRVIPPDEVPDFVLVEIAKRALLGDE